ncbi:MAG: SDR family oxidoreductase [Planctomycetota bacterium]|nr:SDR family oxidoreductase [Planctomycetota bacterium]
MSAWLGLTGRRVLVTGLANKKSVAHHVALQLVEAGAIPIFVVRTEERREQVQKLVGGHACHVCDVRHQEQIEALAAALAETGQPLHGMVHSIAFADYSDGFKPFHETGKAAFLEAMDVSAFSLINLANALKEQFSEDASVVTISISTTTMAAENYGFMAPAKAALDSAVVFLAKSFKAFGKVRFNGVRAGLLKTSSSAGIPGYLDSYLHGEEATLRKQGLRTEEVASTTLFLLSPRSSGIDAQGVVVDAGMGVNYFDAEIVRRVSRPE